MNDCILDNYKILYLTLNIIKTFYSVTATVHVNQM